MHGIGNDWDGMLAAEFEKEYYGKLLAFLAEEYETHRIYPPQPDVFNALRYSSYADTKVVIFGQDPYHQEGQAHGLCFSVNRGVKIPPSLLNIYKELKEDIGMEIPSHGCLSSWALQGVLLLNTVLTVRDSMPNSHKGRGWETFTDVIIRRLNEREKICANSFCRFSSIFSFRRFRPLNFCSSAMQNSGWRGEKFPAWIR